MDWSMWCWNNFSDNRGNNSYFGYKTQIRSYIELICTNICMLSFGSQRKHTLSYIFNFILT